MESEVDQVNKFATEGGEGTEKREFGECDERLMRTIAARGGEGFVRFVSFLLFLESGS
jgi:hypothetical protein